MTGFGDVRDLLVALPHGDPDGATRYVKLDLFPVRHRLIRALEPTPRSVFEFGALYGYFLVTAIDALAYNVDLVAWVDDESHTPGSNFMCEWNLRHAMPGLERIDRFSFAPIYAYAKDRSEIPAGTRADLVQVDAAHDQASVLADLEAAEQLAPRWIMLDDWTAHPSVQLATAKWLGGQPAERWTLSEHETVNGLALLTRQAAT